MSQHVEVTLPPPFQRGGRSCVAATPWVMANPLETLGVADAEWGCFLGHVFRAWSTCTWGTVCDMLVCATLVGIPFLYCKDQRALDAAQRAVERHAPTDLQCDVRCERVLVTEAAGDVRKVSVVFTPILASSRDERGGDGTADDGATTTFRPIPAGPYVTSPRYLVWRYSASMSRRQSNTSSGCRGGAAVAGAVVRTWAQAACRGGHRHDSIAEAEAAGDAAGAGERERGDVHGGASDDQPHESGSASGRSEVEDGSRVGEAKEAAGGGVWARPPHCALTGGGGDPAREHAPSRGSRCNRSSGVGDDDDGSSGGDDGSGGGDDDDDDRHDGAETGRGAHVHDRARGAAGGRAERSAHSAEVLGREVTGRARGRADTEPAELRPPEAARTATVSGKARRGTRRGHRAKSGHRQRRGSRAAAGADARASATGDPRVGPESLVGRP